jgi:hypothetical protein
MVAPIDVGDAEHGATQRNKVAEGPVGDAEFVETEVITGHLHETEHRRHRNADANGVQRGVLV